MKNIFKGEMRQLFVDNKNEIYNYNAAIFPKIAATGIVITGASVVGSFVNKDMGWARNMYIIICCVCCLLFAASLTEKMKKFVLLGLYLECATIYALVLYLSIGLFDDRTAASLLTMLSIFPMTFIDKPYRLLSTNILMYLVHTILAYEFKDGTIAGLDQMNGLTATLIGCALGFYILKTRLEAFDLSRQLLLEKETDMLTGLYNRRKMSEMLADIKSNDKNAPTGVIMMDIDYFKKYNDTHGQGAGDECLTCFGSMLLNNKWDKEIVFYRYGGEEFLAFVWDADISDMREIADNIHECAGKLELDYGNITLSVGYVYRDDEENGNIEALIQYADMAAFRAKNSGRNCVICYNESSN